MKWSNYAKIRLVLVVFVVAIVIGGGNAKADFVFGTPMNMGPTVNSSAEDWSPSISADGLLLYFNSNRSGGYGNHDLWVTKRPTIYDPWGTPENLGPMVNSSAHEAFPSISADGLSLFFESPRPGGSGSFDLWVTTRPTIYDPWGTPENLGPMVNSSSNDATPGISADGLSLFFESDRSGGYGNFDIFVTTRTTPDVDWSAPVNLGATVNSSAWDGGPRISADGLVLFFFSRRSGGFGNYDLWVTTRKTTNNDWGIPVNLGPTVNSSFGEAMGSISTDGLVLFFDSNADWPGRVGVVDMWQAPILPIVDFNGDEFVDTEDLLIMIDSWGTSETLCDIGPMPWGDGVVDEADLKVLMSYWGQEVEDPTLVAYWKLDETEGNIAYDSAGGHHGTLYDEPLWQPEEGMIDGALELDGIDDHIVTDYVLDPADGPFSVFAWIQGGAPSQVVLSQADDANWLCTDSVGGNLMTELIPFFGRSPALPLVSESTITNGEWHKVNFVWDGAQRILYVDDVEVARDMNVQNGPLSSDGGLYIGAGKGLESGTFFSGLIDDVRIYNRAVTP